jgi:hypothetical protein
MKKNQQDSKEANDLRTKILLFAWFSGDQKIIREMTTGSMICSPAQMEICTTLNAYLAWLGRIDTKQALDRWAKSKGDSKLFWAAQALRDPRLLPLDAQKMLLENIAETWNQASPFTKYTLVSELSGSIIANLANAGQKARNLSKLSLDKKKIDNRIKYIEKVEATIEKLSKLPWIRIRVGAWNEWASLYRDFSADIKAIPLPNGLGKEDIAVYQQTIQETIAPFQKKALELRRKSFELAQASAVEPEVFLGTLSPLLKEDPNVSKEVGPYQVIPPSAAFLALESMQKMKWDLYWSAAVIRSLQSKNWPALAYLVQEGESRKLLNEDQLSFMKALNLSYAGAQAEALQELDGHLLKSEAPLKAVGLLMQVAGNYGVRNREKSRQVLDRFAQEVKPADKVLFVPGKGPELVKNTALWLGVEAPKVVGESYEK